MSSKQEYLEREGKQDRRWLKEGYKDVIVRLLLEYPELWTGFATGTDTAYLVAKDTGNSYCILLGKAMRADLVEWVDVAEEFVSLHEANRDIMTGALNHYEDDNIEALKRLSVTSGKVLKLWWD